MYTLDASHMDATITYRFTNDGDSCESYDDGRVTADVRKDA